MERAYPRENFHLGFDASRSLQVLTSLLFRVNGKQPESNLSLSPSVNQANFTLVFGRIPENLLRS